MDAALFLTPTWHFVPGYFDHVPERTETVPVLTACAAHANTPYANTPSTLPQRRGWTLAATFSRRPLSEIKPVASDWL